MIQSLSIQNFQAHEKTKIEFAPGITTIKGPTDSGKSAVLRALRWVCLNDLPGEDFIRDGADSVLAVLRTKNHKIGRGKGSRGNVYTLDDEEFRAFGQSVPQEIQEALRLNEINFQAQHDAPFWFSETAGEVSRRLNAVVDLSVIDTALSYVASEVRRCEERVGLCTERLQAVETEWEQTKDQKQRVVDFEELKNAHEKATEADNTRGRLAALCHTIGSNQAQSLSNKARDGVRVLGLAHTARQSARAVDQLRQLVEGIEEQQNKATAPPDFSEVALAYQTWIRQEEKVFLLDGYVAMLDEQIAEVQIRSTALSKLEIAFHERTDGANCPLCGKIM